MSSVAYPQAFDRHFHRAFERGWCRAPACTVCGARHYRDNLRRELHQAWCEVHGCYRGESVPPYRYPHSVAHRALEALGMSRGRIRLGDPGVDQGDSPILVDELVPDADTSDMDANPGRAFDHEAIRQRIDPDNGEPLPTIDEPGPAVSRLQQLLHADAHAPSHPAFRPDEVGPVLGLSLDDLRRLDVLLASKPHVRGSLALREAAAYARTLSDPSNRLNAVWQQPSRVEPTLAEAYRNTRFVVSDGAREITLQIGVASPEIAALHHRFAVTESCIITAWNPASQQLSAFENAARHRRLEGRTQWLELPTLFAEGRDPKGRWVPELSLWIAGAGLREELFLGQVLGQHAIVCIGPDAVPRLAWPAQARSLMCRD